jgi:hypothetical protein
MLPAGTVALGSVAWTVGDVFVATGNGNYQVWHIANPTAKNPVYTNIQPINDGLGGVTSGCAFDSAYRFFGTNFTNTIVDQYSIDATYGLAGTNGLVGKFATGGGTSTLNESIAFDGQGNFFVGHEGGSKALEKWTRTALNANPPVSYGPYQLTNSWTPPQLQLENSGVDWLDVAQDGHTIFYTSKGRKIFMFDTTAATPQAVVYADLSLLGGNVSKGKLFAIRVVPSAGAVPGSAGVFVADQVHHHRMYRAICPDVQVHRRS